VEFFNYVSVKLFWSPNYYVCCCCHTSTTL